MVRPERNQPLDEWPFARDARGHGGVAFGRRNRHEAAAGVAPCLSALLIGGLRERRAKCPDGGGNFARGCRSRSGDQRRAAC
jgi:hypothetical protein